MITKNHEAPGHGGGTGSPMIFEAEAPLRMQANVKATIFGHMLARASSAAWHNVQYKKISTTNRTSLLQPTKQVNAEAPEAHEPGHCYFSSASQSAVLGRPRANDSIHSCASRRDCPGPIRSCPSLLSCGARPAAPGHAGCLGPRGLYSGPPILGLV